MLFKVAHLGKHIVEVHRVYERLFINEVIWNVVSSNTRRATRKSIGITYIKRRQFIVTVCAVSHSEQTAKAFRHGFGLYRIGLSFSETAGVGVTPITYESRQRLPDQCKHKNDWRGLLGHRPVFP